jgi:hypothetical protein
MWMEKIELSKIIVIFKRIKQYKLSQVEDSIYKHSSIYSKC